MTAMSSPSCSAQTRIGTGWSGHRPRPFTPAHHRGSTDPPEPQIHRPDRRVPRRVPSARSAACPQPQLFALVASPYVVNHTCAPAVRQDSPPNAPLAHDLTTPRRVRLDPYVSILDPYTQEGDDPSYTSSYVFYIKSFALPS
jgi:hypothetical protein